MMRSLVRAELARLRWRRAVILLLAAAFVIPLLVLGSELWNTRPITAEERADAEIEMAVVEAEQTQDCVDAPRQWGVNPRLDPQALRAQCAEMSEMGSVEDWIYRPALTASETRTDSALGVITVLTVLAAVVGTTFVGQDWATGSMSNQLLFESRRGRVWWAKAIALVLGTALTASLVLALYWLGIVGALRSRGIETSGDVWSDVVWTQLRGVVLVAGAALLAYSITTLFRSTVAALGLMFGAAVLSSMLLALVGAGDERWMLHANTWAFVLGSYEYWLGDLGCDEEGSCQATLAMRDGLTYLGVLVVVGVAASLWSFRRRDVP